MAAVMDSKVIMDGSGSKVATSARGDKLKGYKAPMPSKGAAMQAGKPHGADRGRQSGQNQKTRFCMYQLQGVCKHSSESCPFAHSTAEMMAARGGRGKKGGSDGPRGSPTRESDVQEAAEPFPAASKGLRRQQENRFDGQRSRAPLEPMFVPAGRAPAPPAAASSRPLPGLKAAQPPADVGLALHPAAMYMQGLSYTQQDLSSMSAMYAREEETETPTMEDLAESLQKLTAQVQGLQQGLARKKFEPQGATFNPLLSALLEQQEKSLWMAGCGGGMYPGVPMPPSGNIPMMVPPPPGLMQ